MSRICVTGSGRLGAGQIVAGHAQNSGGGTHRDSQTRIGIEDRRTQPVEAALGERTVPIRQRLAPRPTKACGFAEGAHQEAARADPTLPAGPCRHPVIGGASVVFACDKVGFGSFDHAAFVRDAADQRIDHRPRDRRRFQHEPCGGVVPAQFEGVAQKLIRRHAALTSPALRCVQHNIIRPQPGMAGAAAHWRLIDAGGEAERRHCGERARVTRPGDAEEISAPAAHLRHLGVASEAMERPIQRARQPRHAVLFARERRAGPLIGRVEQPDAGEIENFGDPCDFLNIRRARAPEPAPGCSVEQRHNRRHSGREEAETGVAQRARLFGTLPRVARWTAVTDIDDRNGPRGRVHGQIVPQLDRTPSDLGPAFSPLPGGERSSERGERG